MQITQSDDLWLHEHYDFSLTELAELAAVSESQLLEWVEEGLLAPIDPLATPWRFGADRLTMIQRACRLRRDFELEPQGLALVVKLLDRIQRLEMEIRELQAKLPRFVR